MLVRKGVPLDLTFGGFICSLHYFRIEGTESKVAGRVGV